VRISVRAESFTSYRPYRGLTGRVQMLRGSNAGEIATVLFDIAGDDRPLEAHIPVQYLITAKAAPSPARDTAEKKAEKSFTADDGSEAEIQAKVVAFLRELGYRVTVTGKPPEPATCRGCTAENYGRSVLVLCPRHQKPVYSRGAINNSGLADVIVTFAGRWPLRTWTMLEFKKDSKAARKPAQVELVTEGSSVFVWSLRMALEAIREVEQGLGMEPLPSLVAALADTGGAL
jgi:hypothetical protein